MELPAFWVLSEVDSHLVVPHPGNGRPMVLVFTSKRLVDQFNIDHPQRNTIAKGVHREDIVLMMRQWVYGGVEYYAVDPTGSTGTWVPRPVSSFKDDLQAILAQSSRIEAVAGTAEALQKAEARSAEISAFKEDMHAKLFPTRSEPPPSPPPPKPWYEQHGLD